MAIEQYEKYQPYLDYIKEYAESTNAATGSKVDANANVESKNVTSAPGGIVTAEIFIRTQFLFAFLNRIFNILFTLQHSASSHSKSSKSGQVTSTSHGAVLTLPFL